MNLGYILQKIGLKKQSEIIRNDNNHQYINLVLEAENIYPDEPLSQLAYIKEKGNQQFYNLALVAKVQKEANFVSKNNLHYNISEVDHLLRGLLDSLRHMQDGLPDGVYEFITNNIETFILRTIKQLEKEKKLLNKNNG